METERTAANERAVRSQRFGVTVNGRDWSLNSQEPRAGSGGRRLLASLPGHDEAWADEVAGRGARRARCGGRAEGPPRLRGGWGAAAGRPPPPDHRAPRAGRAAAAWLH